MLRKIGMFCLVFVLQLAAIIGVAFLLSRCAFTPIEPVPKEEECITLRNETETTTNTTNTTSITTTGLTTYTTTVETPETVVETVVETVDSTTTKRIEQLSWKIEQL